MDRQDALSAYARALSVERESFLLQQALRKVSSLTRAMSPGEKEEYLKSRAFTTLLWQLKRRDKCWQALQRGELAMDQHQAEFDQLCPLILSELKRDHPLDLPFLRSVQRARVPLSKALDALRLLETGALRSFFRQNRQRLTAQAARRLEHDLRSGSLARRLPRDSKSESAVSLAFSVLYSRGISESALNQAYLPRSLPAALQAELFRAFPDLASCGHLRTRGGEKVSDLIRAEIRQAETMLCRELTRRYPEGRIRALLRQNPSLKDLQKQRDAAAAKEQSIRSALLQSIPEHYKDLYPLARAMRRRFILHLGPTNSGKTYEGVQRLRGASRGIYLGPLRLLAAEQFETLNLDDIPCSLVTGEEQIRVPGSRVQSSTVEMADLKAHYDIAVIDECQMIADRDRGGAWTAAILGLCAEEIHACASPDAEALLTRMILECGDELSVVRHERMTPLEVESRGFQFPASACPGDALIVFSKARVHAVAAELRSRGYRVSLIYGALPPDVRRDQARRFHLGESEVVVSTDAIAMGMNLPIRRVVFLESEKYDGDITRPLTDAEIKQIAGRAGRYGQYEIGYVNAFGFRAAVAHALNKELPPLTEAVIRFPESLLGIPLSLTQILNQWISMQDRGCFSKASTVRMVSLAGMMETRSTDKNLLYRFLCIPFDETDPDLLSCWKLMYHTECAGEHLDVSSRIPGMLNPEDCTIRMLDGLEADYRKCDLYYNYARLFLDNPDPVLEEIQRRKDLISQGIIHILSTQKLQQKTCRSCKRQLPWNWPYRLCDSCFRRQHLYHSRGRTRCIPFDPEE